MNAPSTTPTPPLCALYDILPNEECWGAVEISDYAPTPDGDEYPIYTCQGHRGYDYRRQYPVYAHVDPAILALVLSPFR